MTQNIEQRTEAAVTKYENASDAVQKMVNTDGVVETPVGERSSFPKISREWDNESQRLQQEWQNERDELSTKALGVMPWESGVSESNINQQRRWTDNHTYLPKTIPVLMDAAGPDDNWIPYTADKSDTLNDVFGRKPVDLIAGVVLVPDVNQQYQKLNALGKVWELDDNDQQLAVVSFTELSDEQLTITLDDDSQIIAHKVDGASRSWVGKESLLRQQEAVDGKILVGKKADLIGKAIDGETHIRLINSSGDSNKLFFIYNAPKNGVIGDINPNRPYTVTIDDKSYLLIVDKYISESGFVNPVGAGAIFDKVTDDAYVFQALFDHKVRRIKMPEGGTSWSFNPTFDYNGLIFMGAGSGKANEAGGYQTAVTEIIPIFNSLEPVIKQVDKSNNDCVFAHFAVVYGVGLAQYDGPALAHQGSSNVMYRNVVSSYCKGGLKMFGTIYSGMEYCLSQNADVSYELDALSEVSQCNVITLHKCKAKLSALAYSIQSTTNTTLSDCAAEVISSTLGDSGKYAGGTALIDDNNIGLSVVGNFYVEGADRLIDAPRTNPSKGTVINNFYFNNHENYVVEGFIAEFGSIGSAEIKSGYIKRAGVYSGSGAMTDLVGRILVSSDNATVENVTGGWLSMAAPNPHTCKIGPNNFAISRFKGVFYPPGSDTTKLYANPVRKKYFIGNASFTTNASGYVEVNTGLGTNKVGSLIPRAWIPQNSDHYRIDCWEDGSEIIRLYLLDANDSPLLNTLFRASVYVEVIENF